MHKFTQVDGFTAELIEIPEEFADLSIDDVTPMTYGRRVQRRKYIKRRQGRDIADYDAWRSYDRHMLKGSGRHPAVAKLKIAPADLIKVFGSPDPSAIMFQGTGEYNFEDNNLDLFSLFDYKQTDFFHGINREEDYYVTKRNLKRPMHKRKRQWPTVDEFWTSTEPKEFKLTADEQADWRKFKRWLLM